MRGISVRIRGGLRERNVDPRRVCSVLGSYVPQPGSHYIGAYAGVLLLLSRSHHRWNLHHRESRDVSLWWTVWLSGALAVRDEMATKKKERRGKITLACAECKHRNYITTKNKDNDPDRMILKKYCPNCRCHREHRETR